LGKEIKDMATEVENARIANERQHNREIVAA